MQQRAPPMDISSFYQQLQLSPAASPQQAQAGHHPAAAAALCYYPYHSPPPFATDDGFGHHLPEAHTAVLKEKDNPSPPPPPPKVDGGDQRVVARKDKHRKICTAAGMRDRRMRLSLDVARRFFALQDKLGFDKASKTVQWLLDMSRARIKEVMVSKDGSSLSDTTKQRDEPHLYSESADRKKKRPIKAPVKRAAAPPPRKLSYASSSSSSSSSVDRESRARARERARERTKERNRLRWAMLASSISIEEAAPASSRSQGEDVIALAARQDQWELSGVVFAKARAHASLPLIQ